VKLLLLFLLTLPLHAQMVLQSGVLNSYSQAGATVSTTLASATRFTANDTLPFNPLVLLVRVRGELLPVHDWQQFKSWQ
jgi:hypothetical protein